MRRKTCKHFRSKILSHLVEIMAKVRLFLNLVSCTWFLNIIQDGFMNGKIDFDSTVKLLEKLHMPFNLAHVKHVFKVRNM